MTPTTACVNATFFYITDSRSTDRTRSEDPSPTQATSSAQQKWKYVKS